MAPARTPAERRMGACETTPPATPGTTTRPSITQHERTLPRSPMIRRRSWPQARSSPPPRGCGRSSLTPPARRREPGSCEEDPEEQSGPARRHHASHRVRSVMPLDINGPHGCRRQGFRIAVALAPPSAGACRAGSVVLAAKLIAGHDAEGERREPRPGRSGCRRGPRSGSRAGDGHRPGSSSGPVPGRRPCPGTPRQSRPPRPRPPRRSSKRLPETSVSLPGITLSNEGGRGERARSRRSVRCGRPGP